MPSLKDLNCAIELSESHHALQEFGTTYGDGVVETFVPVPSQPQSFSIHLTSNKFIAPGIALFVYVDGIYQCNRNRQDLKPRKPSDSRSLVDFRVRQKEERLKDGSMIAREWTFDKLNVVSADDAPNICSPDTLENIGCIEVLVLRCAGTRDKPATTMNFDGAGDWPDDRFGWDEKSSRSYKSQIFDDRGPYFNRSQTGFGPLSPLPSYRSPYAESLRSHDGSEPRNRHSDRHVRKSTSRISISHHSQPRTRYSEPVSPHTRHANDLPSSGFQYGSGPIPSDGNDSHYKPQKATVSHKDGVDPVWLNKVVTAAVKQGVKESRRTEEQSRLDKDSTYIPQKEASQAPGTWPESTFAGHAQPSRRSESNSSTHHHHSDHGSWKQSQGSWARSEGRSSKGTRVNWSLEPVWETQTSSSNGWHSSEETPSDSWNTEETWATNKEQRWADASQPAIPPAQSAPVHLNSQPVPLTPSNLKGRRHSKPSSKKHQSRSKSRSRPSRRDHETSSSEERDWAYLEQPSDSVISLSSSNDTVQPSRHRNHAHTQSRKSKSLSRRSKSTHHNHDRASSRRSHQATTLQPTVAQTVPAPTPITLVIPTIVNAPDPVPPPQVQSRQPSVHENAGASVFPAPSVAAPVQETLRKQSSSHSNIPAPYSSWGKQFAWDAEGDDKEKKRSTSSSSWGNDKMSDRDAAAKDSGWETAEAQDHGKTGWDSTDDDKNSLWSEPHKDKKPEATGWDTESTAWNAREPPKEKEQSVIIRQVPDLKTALETTSNKGSKAKERTWENSSWTIEHTSDRYGKTKTDIKWTTPDPFTTTLPIRHSTKSHPKTHQKQKQKRHSAPLPTDPSPPTTKTQQPLPPPPASPHQPSITSLKEDKEPRATIPQSVAAKSGLDHQVRTGKPLPYGHAIARPDYVDSLESPYAVFRFKYRSVEVLERMFGRENVGSVEKDKGEKVRSKSGKSGGGGHKEEKREKEGSRTEEWVKRQVAGLG